jgi:hypothetical protein
MEHGVCVWQNVQLAFDKAKAGAANTCKSLISMIISDNSRFVLDRMTSMTRILLRVSGHCLHPVNPAWRPGALAKGGSSCPPLLCMGPKIAPYNTL